MFRHLNLLIRFPGITKNYLFYTFKWYEKKGSLHKYHNFFRDTFLADTTDSLIRINNFTNENKFKVIADDGTEFKNPVGGLLIYDFEDDPINVELCGIDNDIWKRYF